MTIALDAVPSIAETIAMNPWLQRAIDLATGGPEATLSESILRGSLVFCSFFATIQLLTMLGTRWGNRNTLSKAFSLSVLIHFCLALGGATLVEPSRLLSAGSGHPAAEPEPVRIREVVVEQDQPAGATRTGTAPIWQQSTQSTKADFARNRDDVGGAEVESVDVPRVAQPAPERELHHVIASETRPSTPQRQAADERSRRPATAPPAMPAEELAGEARPEAGTASRSSRRVSRVPEADVVPSGERRRESGGGPAAGTAGATFVAPLSEVAPERISAEPSRGAAGGSSRTAGRARGRGGPELPVIADVPPRTPDPPLENPFKIVSGTLRGVVVDAETRKPIAEATVRVDQAQGKPLTTVTEPDGTFSLKLPETPENFAITATHEGHVPESRNMRGADVRRQNPRLDFSLRPVNESVIAVEEDPAVHHLGNDRFQGTVNSRFQRASEGASLLATFTVTPEQIRAKPARASLSLLVKGVQCAPQIRINGTLLTAELEKSPLDGSFRAESLPFRPSLLRAGDNRISIQSVECNGDLDDFELVNMQIRLLRRE